MVYLRLEGVACETSMIALSLLSLCLIQCRSYIGYNLILSTHNNYSVFLKGKSVIQIADEHIRNLIVSPRPLAIKLCMWYVYNTALHLHYH